VKVKKIDNTGRVDLTRKQLLRNSYDRSNRHKY